jgi:cytochrome c
MDAFELNKISGAVLLALLVMFGARATSNVLFKVHQPEKPGYMVEVPDAPEHGSSKTAEAPQVPFATLLASASAEKGMGVAKRCSACHSFDKGGKNKIGPNIYGVLGSKLGAVDGFAYSGALKAKGGTWDYEALNQFLANPKAFIPGTKMSFAGIKRDGQRADLVLYLRQQGDNKPPLPEVMEKVAPEAAASEAKASEKAAPEPAEPAAEAPKQH